LAAVSQWASRLHLFFSTNQGKKRDCTRLPFCTVPENIHTPPPCSRDQNFLEDRGFYKTKNLKKHMKLYWNFQEGQGSFWNYTK